MDDEDDYLVWIPKTCPCCPCCDCGPATITLEWTEDTPDGPLTMRGQGKLGEPLRFNDLRDEFAD
jgi:hypothetical protein